MSNTTNNNCCSGGQSIATTAVKKTIAESDNLVTAIENVGAMYGVPSSNILVDNSLSSIKVVGDNIIAPSNKNAIGNTKAIMCSIGAVLDNISQRIDDKLTEFQLSNIEAGKQSSIRRYGNPSKGNVIGRDIDDNGNEILAYDSGIIDHANTDEGVRKAINMNPGYVKPSYFSDEDDITKDVDISVESEPVSTTDTSANMNDTSTSTTSGIQDTDVSESIGESAVYLDLISKFNDTRNLGADLLNSLGFEYVKPIQESASSKKRKEIKPEDIKYMKFDNTNIIKAIKYFNLARAEQSNAVRGRWNKSDLINNVNYQKGIDCLNKQFNCRINIRFIKDSEDGNNLFTAVYNDIKNNLSISKSKGFQLNGLPIDIFVINESIDEEMSKDTDNGLFGQFMVSSLLHEIFHNIYAVMFKDKAEYQALLESTLGLASTVKDVKKRRIILTNYVNTLNAMNGSKMGRFSRRKLIKQLMCMVEFQHDEKILDSLLKKAEDNDVDEDANKNIDELIRVYQSYVNKYKIRKKSKLEKVFKTALGILLCITPLVPVGVYLLMDDKIREKAMEDYKSHKNMQEYYCDLFAGMYKLPIAFLIGYKNNRYTSNSVDNDKLNKLAMLEKDIHEINFSIYPTLNERNLAAVTIAKNLLDIDKDLDPAVKKYLEWIVANHSNVLNTDIKEIYNTTTFDPKTAEDLDNHLQNLIGTGVTLTESDLSWILDDSIICESANRFDDEGKPIPEKCPKCGSDVELYLKGEPVWLCSNKKCNTYFGVAPCNIQESVESFEEEITLESEFNTISTLIDCYAKQAIMLEQYENGDIVQFSIFQEGFSDIINTAKGDSSENLFLRIIKFIPRLIGAIVKALRNMWGNKKNADLINRIEQLEKLTDEQKQSIKALIENNNELSNAYNDLDKRVKKNKIKIDYEVGKLQQSISEINYKIDIMCNSVKVNLNFEGILKFFKNIIDVFEILEKWDFNNLDMIKKSFDEIKDLNIQLPDIINDTLKNYTFDDIKGYMRQTSDMVTQINSKGDRIQNRFTKYTKKYEAKNKKNKDQEDLYVTIGMASTKLMGYLTSAKSYADIVSKKYAELAEGFDKYGQYAYMSK